MSDDDQGDIGADLNIIKASIDDVVEEEVVIEKPKGKRGRPKKIKSPTSLFAVKRPRGRPKGSGTKTTPKKFTMADRSEGSRVIKPSERMSVGSPAKVKSGTPRGRGRPKKSTSSASPATPGRGRGRPRKSEGTASVKVKRGRGRPRKDGSVTPGSAIKRKTPKSSFGPGRPRKDGLPPGSVPASTGSAVKRARGRPKKRVANVKKGRKPKVAEVVAAASESDSDSDSNMEEQPRPVSSSDSEDSD